MKNIIALVIVFLLVFMNFTSISGIQINNQIIKLTYRDNTLYVGGSGPNNYTTIQGAIDDSSDGDTVFVYDDSSPYIEHLTITKSIIINGENKVTTKIFGKGENKDILFIKSNETIVSNFTIQYGSDHNSGMLIKDSLYVTISDCRFFDIPSMDAITISNSENINIFNCLMSDSIEKIKSEKNNRYISGITLEGGCCYTNISGNKISNASYAGIIVLEGCDNTIISGNYIYSNDKYGIRAQHCNNTFIKENKILKNQLVGIVIFACINTLINRNLCENNNNAGVGIGDSVNTHVVSNNFIHNGLIGYFSYNFGGGFPNIFPDIIWDGNFWDRARVLPKLIFGAICYQKDSQSPLFIFPWILIDWHPAKEPYNYTTTQGCAIE